MNLKFAHKLDAPATLGVTVDAVDMDGDRVTLRGSTTGRKAFVLDLQLWGDIEAEGSTWSLGSVGRCTLTLRKAAAAPAKWPTLLADGVKLPKNAREFFFFATLQRRMHVTTVVSCLAGRFFTAAAAPSHLCL